MILDHKDLPEFKGQLVQVSVTKVNYALSYPQDKRHITPSLVFPLGETPLQLDSSGAALTHLAEVLYLDLSPKGLGVSVVHPGFVATPLTAQNNFHMPALISPEQAAQAMLQGWRDGQFDIHFPKRFTLFLKLLRLLPYRWYFPLVRRFTGL